MPTLALNFSRPSAQFLLRCCNFRRLGRDGRRRVHMACRDAARWFATEVASMEQFELLSDGSTMPLVTRTLTHDQAWDLHDLSSWLREGVWQVPPIRCWRTCKT